MSYNELVTSKALTYFENRYKVKKSTKGWYRCDCPFCFGKFSFGININIGKAKCHKCSYNERLINCISELEGSETSNDTIVYLDNNFDESVSHIFNKTQIDKVELKLPESFRLMSFGDDYAAKSARAYMKGRGFSIDYLTYRGVGYCNDGKYQGCIIFPIYYNGVLRYFTDRRYIMALGNGRKFTNLTKEEIGVGKSTILYNRDALYIYKRVFLVESVINALTMGDRGVGALGKELSSYQFSDVIRSPVKEVVILLDPDALSNAITLAIKLCRYKRVKLVYWKGTDDVNKLGRKKVMKIVNSFKFQTYKELINIKNTYEYKKDAIYTLGQSQL